MKTILHLVIVLIFIQKAFCQTIVENKKDEFTGNSIIRTSWETIQSNFHFTGYFRISRINDHIYFDLKMILGSGGVFAINKDDQLMFKLENDSIITLYNLEYALTCSGCGAISLAGSSAQGIKTSYSLSEQNVEELKKFKIVKWRIYTTNGYVEDEIKEKKQELIRNALIMTSSKLK
jgi:hypothetical protein